LINPKTPYLGKYEIDFETTDSMRKVALLNKKKVKDLDDFVLIPDFRLPTEAEWEYVSKINLQNNVNPSGFVGKNGPNSKYKNMSYDDAYNSALNDLMNKKTNIKEFAIEKSPQAKIEEQKYKGPITNLEEQALALVGKDIYEKLIKGYTTKQWGKNPTELPASIIKRLPVRFTWDNNYFNDQYQGIPIGGYTQIFEKLLSNIEIQYNVDYLSNKDYFNSISNHIIYTGPIDAFFNYSLDRLEYKSVSWRSIYYDDTSNFQGNAVINYPNLEIPYTRIIEHKHFDNRNQNGTFISYEYPQEYNHLTEPFYPVNDDINNKRYNEYKNLASQEKNITFGGRLAEYKYYDMHQIIASAYKTLQTLNK
jgi:UDP-galactopyranose mutase